MTMINGEIMKNSISSEKITASFNTHGAEMTSLLFDGIEYIWQGDPKYWKGQAPVCFPIVGSLKNNSILAFGKKCSMTRHGFAKKCEFQIAGKTENSISFSLKANEETRKEYPFDFELIITYTAKGNTLTTSFKVINTGDEDMPFCVGGHPAFNCPLDNGDYSDWYVEFEKEEHAACMRSDENGFHNPDKRSTRIDGTKLILDHELFARDSMSFDNLVSRKATLKSNKSEHGLTVEYEQFPNLVIWSAVGDAPFIALEPWKGLSFCSDEDGLFEHKHNVTILKPNETSVASFDITVF